MPYWWSKESIEGMSGGIGGLTKLQDILKVLVGMLLVVRVFCCSQYQNWQALICNEALNGGGCLDVYLGAMIL